MKESLGQYIARDGRILNFRKWHGPDDIIVYLHGIESHSAWFSSFASSLSCKGFALYGIDRRGSGLNREERGDVRDYNIFLDDIEDAIGFIKKENPAKKIYLLGICWGGFLAVNYSLTKRLSAHGLILLSPAIYRKVDLKPAIKIAAKACSFFYPKACFKIPIKDYMFTENENYIGFIKNDRMRVRSLTCRFLKEIIRMEDDFLCSSDKLFLPTLVLLAGRDEIVDNNRIRQWFDSLPLAEKSIKTFVEFFHVMPFEKDITVLVNEISTWIKERKARIAIESIQN